MFIKNICKDWVFNWKASKPRSNEEFWLMYWPHQRAPQIWCFRDNSKSLINRCTGHWSYWVWWHHFRRVHLHSYSVRLESPNAILGKTLWVVILANIWFSYIFWPILKWPQSNGNNNVHWTLELVIKV